MYAVIEVEGRQYKVQKGERFAIDGFIRSKKGSSIDIKKALLVKEGNAVHIGTPYVKGAEVSCQVVGHIKGDKVIAYKYRRRKSSKKKIGSRRHLTELMVKEINIKK